MDEDQKLSALALLAVGFVLGRLANVGLRYRHARVPYARVPVTQARAELVSQSRVTGPTSASWRYADELPKKKRKRLFLTNNAALAGIVSAIVAGSISFLVAYYQGHDAARQAVVGQQVQAASQLQSAATVYYDIVMNDYNFWLKCDARDSHWPPACPKPAGFNDMTEDANKLLAATFNISDWATNSAAADLWSTGTAMLHADSRQAAKNQMSSFSYDYVTVIVNCGKIIEGR